MSLQEGRDIVIIVVGSVMFFVLVTILVFTVVLGLTTRSLLSTLRELLQTEVTPLVTSARQTVQQVQGTTAFVGERAVAPIIRIYSLIAGLRRMLATLLGFVDRRSRRGR